MYVNIRRQRYKYIKHGRGGEETVYDVTKYGATKNILFMPGNRANIRRHLNVLLYVNCLVVM
jgi:hypothetical protein